MNRFKWKLNVVLSVWYRGYLTSTSLFQWKWRMLHKSNSSVVHSWNKTSKIKSFKKYTWLQLSAHFIFQFQNRLEIIAQSNQLLLLFVLEVEWSKNFVRFYYHSIILFEKEYRTNWRIVRILVVEEFSNNWVAKGVYSEQGFDCDTDHCFIQTYEAQRFYLSERLFCSTKCPIKK